MISLLIKPAVGVDACRHGLHGLHAMRVDMHAEACVSTVSGFGWPACWSSVAKAGLLMAANLLAG